VRCAGAARHAKGKAAAPPLDAGIHYSNKRQLAQCPAQRSERWPAYRRSGLQQRRNPA
jgi:hypothetical protein